MQQSMSSISNSVPVKYDMIFSVVESAERIP